MHFFCKCRWSCGLRIVHLRYSLSIGGVIHRFDRGVRHWQFLRCFLENAPVVRVYISTYSISFVSLCQKLARRALSAFIVNRAINLRICWFHWLCVLNVFYSFQLLVTLHFNVCWIERRVSTVALAVLRLCVHCLLSYSAKAHTDTDCTAPFHDQFSGVQVISYKLLWRTSDSICIVSDPYCFELNIKLFCVPGHECSGLNTSIFFPRRYRCLHMSWSWAFILFEVDFASSGFCQTFWDRCQRS